MRVWGGGVGGMNGGSGADSSRCGGVHGMESLAPSLFLSRSPCHSPADFRWLVLPSPSVVGHLPPRGTGHLPMPRPASLSHPPRAQVVSDLIDLEYVIESDKLYEGLYFRLVLELVLSDRTLSGVQEHLIALMRKRCEVHAFCVWYVTGFGPALKVDSGAFCVGSGTLKMGDSPSLQPQTPFWACGQKMRGSEAGLCLVAG